MQIASLNRITLLKNSLMIAIILTSPAVSPAQPFSLEKPVVDNYKDLVAKHAPDTATVHAFYWLSRNITLSNTSEAIDLAGKGLDLARKIKFRSGEIECM